MVPLPQESQPRMCQQEVAPTLNGNSVVISGMSGLFPMSESVKNFSLILYNQVNPVSSGNSRWTLKHHEASEFTGKVPNLDRFDSQFFMVHRNLGEAMDPMARKVLEHSYQAIYDAGLSPKHLNGKNVGVYVGSAFSETEKFGSTECKTGYGITGVSKTMYANRVSYWLNAKGPSVSVDDACCGSMVALEEAFKAIKSGICEAAIVAGTNLCLAPHTQVHYNRCIKISPDGRTRSFDEKANGCAKSEAISVLFLQKAKHALRAYAEVVYVKSEFISHQKGESGQIFGFIRDPDNSAEFLRKFYSEAGVAPQLVQYVEACGSASPEADKAELQSLEKVFCNQRTDPLLVGSVISNIGFTDAASGATAITKVLLGYHTGVIASNLNCESPRQDVTALREGRMRVVTQHQPLPGAYAAVNCLSITGVNSHALLRTLDNTKDLNRYASSIPRLVMVSARQKDYLKNIFDDLKSRPIDAEELALLHNIHSTNISGHLGRGYVILDTDEQQNTVALSEVKEHFDEMRRPLWFVYSGMGSQWAGMGAQLMRIPIFAAAIERCQKALPKDVDLVHILTSQDKTIFDNVLNSFVGIAAVQIGLTDILTALGLRPDNIIGHSVGELGCAYADGCLTAEEMILSAYSRGKASNETDLIRGAMAAVGLGYQQLAKMCPSSIDIACHNSATSSTISGPAEKVRKFVALLTSKQVFAKEVPSANIAYHSRYIAKAGPNLLSLLSEIIKEPKARSERWLSTSVPEKRWNDPVAKYCSPEYLTNNLLNSVLFEETMALIPSHAVLIEIAPHGLLQAILKRALPESCKNIPLTQRGHKDNVLHLLDAIGRMYINGFNPQVQTIYPKVKFPVSTGTPHLAQHVKLNHTESWTVSLAGGMLVKSAPCCTFLITVHDDEYNYLNGNIIGGKILYPFAGALVAAWDTLAMTLGLPKKKLSVRFQDVHLYSQPILHRQKRLQLGVNLQRGNGKFEVLEKDSKIATGYITMVEDTNDNVFNTTEKFVISSDEIYQHFGTRGYFYRDDFQSIHAVNESLTTAQIAWNDNWVTLIDGLLQLNDLRSTCDRVAQPTQIRDLTIDVNKHLESVQRAPLNNKTVLLTAEINDIFDSTRFHPNPLSRKSVKDCGGVLLQNLKFRNLPSLTQGKFELISSNIMKNVRNTTPLVNLSSKIKFALRTGRVGELDSLHWEETPNPPTSGVKVLVEYVGINILDVKKASGIIPFENSEEYFGMDFSGVTERGDRVMGLVRNGAASTVVSAAPELLWPVPAHWTQEEAATVPLAYLQAYYYLCVKNELHKGWRVLVHGAAGALGQAAVSVALAHGCQVFATVADNAKKRFLLKLFPQLNESMIGNSRDESFGDMVLNATNGEGCNIILSCVQDDLKNISLKCTAFSGVTIDMVQIQNKDKYEYGMFNMTKQRSYIAADFYSVLDSGNRAEIRKLQMLVTEGIALGHVQPLTRVSFAPREAPRAFRLLAASRHRGRVLLRLRDSQPQAQPRLVCSPGSTHLIFWDGSLFGLQLADRLIALGATKLSICCLQPTPKLLLKLRLWEKKGVDVVTLSSPLTDSDILSTLLKQSGICESVEGIYVSDTRIASENRQHNEISTVIDHLDTISRKLFPHLRYFAVITVNNDVGQQACLSRFRDGLSATVLRLPVFKSDNDILSDESSWNRSALDVTEQALLSNSSVAYAQLQAVDKPSLIALIPKTTGTNDMNISLKDLGVGESLPLIKSYLQNIYHISLENEDILQLTIKRILEIEKNSSEQILEDIKGLRIFFSNIDLDELHATMDLMPMDTLVFNVNTMEGSFDVSRPHLFIIPGLEGHHAKFRALCERLKLLAVVLQPGLDRPHETPREQALRYAEILLQKFKLKTRKEQNFYLLGYECGIFVALELASILENNGLTGTVYCIGDGPEEIKNLLEEEVRQFGSDEALQEGVVRHMCSLMTRDLAPALDVTLRGCTSWHARVGVCIRTLLGHIPLSAQYARALMEAAYARIETVRRFSAVPRSLRSRLVLMRVRRVLDHKEENSLQRYSRHALKTTQLAAPMAHAAADLSVPAIINRYLDQEILEQFYNSNLCEPYFMMNNKKSI